MTREDTGRLFTLLKQFFPNKNITPELRLAWELVLEPYAYEEVRAAAIAYTRKHKFFPDVADLTADLMPMQEEQEEPEEGRDAPADWMLKHILPDNPHSVSRYARERGISWEEAKRRMEEAV